MLTHLFLDIETLPAQRPDVLEEIRENCKAELEAAVAAVRPPSNYGAEAAAKWEAEKGKPQRESLMSAREAAIDAAYRKTGLDGAFGQICVIGWALGDGNPRTVYNMDWQAPGSELSVLEAFYCDLTDTIPLNMERATRVIGHNVAGFDLRYLMQRSIVNNVQPHRVIASAAQAKPWEIEKVYDTMIQWGGLKPGGSLDKLCKALSIPSPKGDITGATVWDAVKAGRIGEVADYCKRDVVAVREVYRRMTFTTVPADEFDDVTA